MEQSNIWEIKSDESLDRIPEVYSKYGFVILKNVLDADKIAEFSNRVSSEFDRLQKDKGALNAASLKCLNRCEMPAHPEHATVRLEVENYDFLISERIKEVVQLLTKEEFVWHYPYMIRKLGIERSEGLLPYHQDFTYNTHYSGLITCWIPLVECGEMAPGLEFINSNVRERLTHHPSGLWENKVDPSEIENLIKEYGTTRPVFKLGDVAIFDELTLHRSHVTPEMKNYRFSIDSRAVPINNISSAYKESRKFVRSDEPSFKVF